MVNKVVDLAVDDAALPSSLVLDSNVIITMLEPTGKSQSRRGIVQATKLLNALQRSGGQALLTPAAYSEVIHAAIKNIYGRERASRRPILTAHFGRQSGFSWLDLYKLDPSILQHHQNLLETWRERLVAANIVLLDHADLGPIPSGQRYDRELLDLVVRYGLDTSDATILMEAMRIGLRSIVSFDRDMQRAVADFDVYTWLS